MAHMISLHIRVEGQALARRTVMWFMYGRKVTELTLIKETVDHLMKHPEHAVSKWH